MTWTPVLWLLPFIPALVALYFLKLRRRDVVISSTILWRRSLEDFRVNAPFQRLRRNLLLLLQLIVLAGLILAVWKPRTQGDVTSGRHLIVLIDHSASASAKEPRGLRLDLQKEEETQGVQTVEERPLLPRHRMPKSNRMGTDPQDAAPPLCR